MRKMKRREMKNFITMEIVVKKQRRNLEVSLVLNLTMATSLVVNQKRNLEMNLVMMAPPPQEHLMMIAQMRKMKRREMKNFIKLLSFQKLIKKNKKLIALHMKKKKKIGKGSCCNTKGQR